ncbi:glycerophosphodiester phosphodiesterase [bacterium]|nr:glycerophosphodiester phosphodiesterase [bacterium]
MFLEDLFSKFHIQAHRGASPIHTENTLEAIEYAARKGADSIEIDLHLTDDNQWIVFHDFHLQTGQLTRERKKVPSDFFHIPTLEKTLQLQQSLSSELKENVVLDLEIKSDPRNPSYSRDGQTLAIEIYKIIEEHRLHEHIMLRSFDPMVVATLRKLNKNLILSFLTLKDFDLKKHIHKLSELPINIWAPEACDNLDLEAIALAKHHGLKIIPWTVNTPKEFKHFQSLGVDGLTTDDLTLYSG